MLFNINEKSVDEIKEMPYTSEKKLQTLCENNSKELADLHDIEK